MMKVGRVKRTGEFPAPTTECMATERPDQEIELSSQVSLSNSTSTIWVMGGMVICIILFCGVIVMIQKKKIQTRRQQMIAQNP